MAQRSPASYKRFMASRLKQYRQLGVKCVALVQWDLFEDKARTKFHILASAGPWTVLERIFGRTANAENASQFLHVLTQRLREQSRERVLMLGPSSLQQLEDPAETMYPSFPQHPPGVAEEVCVTFCQLRDMYDGTVQKHWVFNPRADPADPRPLGRHADKIALVCWHENTKAIKEVFSVTRESVDDKLATVRSQELLSLEHLGARVAQLSPLVKYYDTHCRPIFTTSDQPPEPKSSSPAERAALKQVLEPELDRLVINPYPFTEVMARIEADAEALSESEKQLEADITSLEILEDSVRKEVQIADRLHEKIQCFILYEWWHMIKANAKLYGCKFACVCLVCLLLVSVYRELHLPVDQPRSTNLVVIFHDRHYP